jgi:ribonucleoside-diphosphate reductase alpha chain
LKSPVPAPFEQQFAYDIFTQRYAFDGSEDWAGLSHRVSSYVMGALYSTPGARRARVGVMEIDAATERIYNLHNRRQFIAGGRYLYATGRDFNQVNNCVLLNCPDSREGWAMTSQQAEMSLMTGAGIGVYYGELRPGGSGISRTGGISSGPLAKMQQINETGRAIISGGNRRSAIWAGLPWFHNDILEFIEIKDWSDAIKALKEEDWNFPAPMDMTNISVSLDDAFFAAIEGDEVSAVAALLEDAPAWLHKQGVSKAPDGGSWTDWARKVYDKAVRHMLRHGEPGFSVDRGDKRTEKLRNACTEITSADDSDICNLGSLVLPRFESPQQFEDAVRYAALFLTGGSLYSMVPYEKVAEVREKNRRLGLGLMGLHEFLVQRGVKYGSDEAFEVLEPYMDIYARTLEFAIDWQDRLGISRSVAATAIAPNGTIGAVGETSPSADPIFALAEIREVKGAKHYGGDTYQTHVVVDPIAARWVANGVDPKTIEDAYTVPYDRRIAQTAFLQRYVDHAISGTVNLPYKLERDVEVSDFSSTLMKHLPHLRGITVYPDGARAGQPRTSVPLDWALEQQGRVLETDDATCAGGVCGL